MLKKMAKFLMGITRKYFAKIYEIIFAKFREIKNNFVEI